MITVRFLWILLVVQSNDMRQSTKVFSSFEKKYSATDLILMIFFEKKKKTIVLNISTIFFF